MNREGRGNKERGHITAFYIETLFLAVIFVAMILILLRVFSQASVMSDNARELTCAVGLAESAAEAVAASGSQEELIQLLDENGNVRPLDGGGICAEYGTDGKPAPGGGLQVEVTWEPEENGCVNSIITVCRKGEKEPVYSLTTAVYVEEAVP